MGLLRYLLNNPQLLIVLLFVAGPVLRGIFEHLKKQAQARQAEIARERARIDALRTGGKAQDDALPAGVMLERRALQRQGMAGGRQPQASLPGRVTTAPQAGQPSKKRRDGSERRGPRVPGQPAPTSAQQAPAGPQRRAASSTDASETVEARRRQATPREEPAPGPSALQRDAATRDEAARVAAGVALAASAQSKAAWRRAIVMQELLMPPVSMR